MFAGTTLYAAGHGRVSGIADPDATPTGPYGGYVDIDHGSETSKYAHLNDVFVSPGMDLCRHVAIGYSGNTGMSSGPHLHFGGEPDPNQLAPMHGIRPLQYGWGNFTFDPYAVPAQPTKMISHDGVATDAYTVDDTQTGEFFRHGSATGWMEDSVGFGYFSPDTAPHMWYVRIASEWTHYADWCPILPVDGAWDVYVFIPKRHATARSAHYAVHWKEDGMNWSVDDPIYIDQLVHANEWVRLGSAEHPSYQTVSAGQYQLCVRVVNDCPQGGCGPLEELGVDATLYVPHDCGD